MESKKSDIAIHIRTTLRSTYSFIEQAAIKVDQSVVLEFHHDALYINGGMWDSSESFPMKLSDTVKIKQEHRKKGHSLYQVDLVNSGLSISVKITHKKYMSVGLGGSTSMLSDAVGMFGEYGTGNLYGRDGRAISDFEEHGFEWQVHPDQDGKLFAQAREPEWPIEQCRMPPLSQNTAQHRALRGPESVLYQQAMQVCAESHPNDVNLCINDVMMTGDIDILEAW